MLGIVYAPDTGAGTGASGDAATGPNGGEQGSTQAGDKPANTASNGDGQVQGQQQAQGQGGDTAQTEGSDTQQAADAVTMPRTAFNERLTQERQAGARELLRELGFEVGTPEAYQAARSDMKGLLDFARQQKEASMTAEERAAEQAAQADRRIKAVETERDSARADLEKAHNELRAFIVRTAILAEAPHATYPDDVHLWAITHQGEQVAKVIKPDVPLFLENGALNPAAIDREVAKAIVTECVKERRQWFKPTTPGVPSNANAQPPTPAVQEIADKKAAARSIIRF
jgi:hypothetical protein